MNILFTYVTPFHPARGGIGRVTDSLTREFIRRGHKVFYLIYPSLMHPFGMDDTESFKFPVPIEFTPDSNIESKENIAFYKYFLERNQIDVVINQSGCSEDTHLWCNAIKWNIPVISCIHSCPARYMRNMWQTEIWPLRQDGIIEKLKRVARIALFYKTRKHYLISDRIEYKQTIENTSKICLLSDKFYKNIEYFNIDFDYSSKLCAIPNPNSFTENKLSDLHISEKKKQLLYVGLFNDAKGTYRLINIWKRLYRKHPDWEMIIVGGGKPELESRIKRLGSKLPRLKFEGIKDNPLPYYKDASIFCMTSNFEGWGMVLTEAQQCGTVPLAFNSFASVKDIIQDGENGFLIKPFDIKEYAQKLDLLMSNDSIRETMARNAMESVKKFDVSNVANKWEKLFRELVKSK